MQAIVRNRQAIFVWAVLLALLIVVLSASEALPAFGIALALMFLLDPAVGFLERRGVWRWLGVLLMYAVVVVVIWAVVGLVIRPLAGQFSEFITKLPSLWATFAVWQAAVEEWWAHLPLPPDVIHAIEGIIGSGQQTLIDLIESAVGPLLRLAARAVAFAVGLVVIPVFLFYVLKDRRQFGGALLGLLPGRWEADVRSILAILGSVAGRWIRGQLLLGLAVGVATYVGLMLLSVAGLADFAEFALLLALLAGILEWLPIIGPILASIPAIMIGLAISPAAGVAAVILYVVIQQVENHLLVPKVMGDAVDLHPAVLIFALVVAASLAGIWGAVLAAPVTSALRDLYRYVFLRLEDRDPKTALQAALSGTGPAPPPIPADEATGP